MTNGYYHAPKIYNEPKLHHAPGSPERAELKEAIERMRSQEIDIPMIIGGRDVRTDETVRFFPPHQINHTLGHYHKGDKTHVEQAIHAALDAKDDWANTSIEHRASIFLKAADLLAGPYRKEINGSTMLGQSKSAWQAEIEAACELIDFIRFNVKFMQDLYREQPYSPDGVWNRMEYRPLEGFILAITPFNFTAISGNLPMAPALMGNTVVWKPTPTQIYSARVIMEVLQEAGLPDGVINMIFTDGPECGDTCISHPDFAGLHFTGSEGTFQKLWRQVGENVANHKCFPRVVGETGGKDFVIAHPSADVQPVVTAISRGAFEYQGQKCSAVARTYIPQSMWDEVRERLLEDVRSMKVGGPEDFRNFVNAVIDERAYEKITGYIDRAHQDEEAEIIIGGTYDNSEGYFIDPTVIVTTDPQYITMREEIFGPVVTIYVYDDAKYEETLDILDQTSRYGLTGAVFAKDRSAIQLAEKKLTHAAGNFYINDKPTGSIVHQQPFGGARRSGTNDKAGSKLNLTRWVTARAIKENFVPATEYRYPFMDEQ